MGWVEIEISKLVHRLTIANQDKPPKKGCGSGHTTHLNFGGLNHIGGMERPVGLLKVIDSNVRCKSSNILETVHGRGAVTTDH